MLPPATSACAPGLDRIAGRRLERTRCRMRGRYRYQVLRNLLAALTRGAADWPARAPRWRHGGCALERTDVLRLRSLLPLGRVELDLLVLIQRPVAGARDRGEVHEHVRRPVIGGDETKALIGVEPLHCSCCHESVSSIRYAVTRPRRADREHTRP